jgi:hypothetical protein
VKLAHCDSFESAGTGTQDALVKQNVPHRPKDGTMIIGIELLS